MVTHLVKIGTDNYNLGFVPDDLTIKAGDIVQFEANTMMPHNVVFDKVPEGVNASELTSGQFMFSPGQREMATLNTPGTYTYYCQPHRGAGENGKITVTE